MLLTANNLGLGSLWIGDIFLCISKLKYWLNKKGEIIAYIALLGYADEKPVVRPRKKILIKLFNDVNKYNHYYSIILKI